MVEYNEESASKLRNEVDNYMDDFLDKSELDRKNSVCFIATSSSPLRLVSMIRNFGEYDRQKADGLVMTKDEMDEAIANLLQSRREELAANPYIGDKRSYIFIAACVIFKTIYERLGVREITASLKSAKDGIVASLIERDKDGKVN